LFLLSVVVAAAVRGVSADVLKIRMMNSCGFFVAFVFLRVDSIGAFARFFAGMLG
jgi:hypothetical protein